MYNAELRLGLESEPDLEERYRTTVNYLVQAHNETPELPTATNLVLEASREAKPETNQQVVTVGPQSSLSGLSTPARQNYIAARNALGEGAWMRRDLQTALSCQRDVAADRIKEWKAAGLIVDVSAPKWHYRFTERG